MVNAVVRQLEFEALSFELVLVGGLFRAGEPLIAPLRTTVHALAPGARLVRLEMPPVVGAVLLGMEAGGHEPNGEVRRQLGQSTLTLQVQGLAAAVKPA
jgi:hypothetical protein